MPLAEWMSTLQIRLFTFRFGEKVGADQYGNRYFRKPGRNGLRDRRWVMFKGEREASKVPPEWHGWLHHTHDAPIEAGSPLIKPWVKPHIANMTGTPAAYRPPGHQLEGGVRERATGDYQAWTP